MKVALYVILSHRILPISMLKQRHIIHLDIWPPSSQLINRHTGLSSTSIMHKSLVFESCFGLLSFSLLIFESWVLISLRVPWWPHGVVHLHEFHHNDPLQIPVCAVAYDGSHSVIWYLLKIPRYSHNVSIFMSRIATVFCRFRHCLRTGTTPILDL